MTKHPLPDEEIPDIRITDEVIKRMVAEEQRRIGDPNVTKTAGRIIERYFAMTAPSRRQPVVDMSMIAAAD